MLKLIPCTQTPKEAYPMSQDPHTRSRGPIRTHGDRSEGRTSSAPSRQRGRASTPESQQGWGTSSQQEQRRRELRGLDAHPPKSRKGLWIGLAIALAIILVPVAIAATFLYSTHTQLTTAVSSYSGDSSADGSDAAGDSAQQSAIQMVMDETGLSYWQLLMLYRDMQGASREEALAKAHELGLTDEQIQSLRDQLYNR
ncbi:MAG: hypothetical protein FWE51_00105 [Coriobacteriia bacterium]|nr:hypothetical protein [Coriobacteriia bacterium]